MKIMKMILLNMMVFFTPNHYIGRKNDSELLK